MSGDRSLDPTHRARSAGLLPPNGDHWIVHDGAGAPQVVLRGVELRLGPLDIIDDAFAWEEREDDRTRDAWLDSHARYFQRTLGRTGGSSTARIDVELERFRVGVAARAG